MTSLPAATPRRAAAPEAPPAPPPPRAARASAFIKRHPVPTYFALAFAISWGGALLAIGGPAGIPGTPEQTERLAPLVIAALVAGPTVAGLLLTGLVSGRTGYRELLARLLRWRVSVRWYAVALLTAPLLIAGVLLALSLLSREFLPGILTTDDEASLLLVFIPAAIAAGVFEELGWTGFALPRLRRRYGVLATGLTVGVLWGAWHLLRPVAIAGVPSSFYALVLAAALWVVVAAVAVANGGRLTLGSRPATTRTPPPAEETARAHARAA